MKTYNKDFTPKSNIYVFPFAFPFVHLSCLSSSLILWNYLVLSGAQSLRKQKIEKLASNVSFQKSCPEITPENLQTLFSVCSLFFPSIRLHLPILSLQRKRCASTCIISPHTNAMAIIRKPFNKLVWLLRLLFIKRDISSTALELFSNQDTVSISHTVCTIAS